MGKNSGALSITTKYYRSRLCRSAALDASRAIPLKKSRIISNSRGRTAVGVKCRSSPGNYCQDEQIMPEKPDYSAGDRLVKPGKNVKNNKDREKLAKAADSAIASDLAIIQPIPTVS